MARPKGSINKKKIPNKKIVGLGLNETQLALLPKDMEVSASTQKKIAPEVKSVQEELNSPQKEADEEFYFEVEEEGTEGYYATDDLKDRIIALYERNKGVPRSQWRKIKFLVPTCDPMVGLKQFEKIMDKAIAKNDRRELAKMETFKKLDNIIWRPGTIVRVPPEIAEFYVGQKYFLGYEGFGDPSKYVTPGQQVGVPKYQHVAEYVKE